MRFWRRQALALAAVTLAVTLVTFAVTELLPGDPAVAILGEQATPEAVAQLHRELGLDRPLHVRYLAWLGGVLTGDLGYAYKTREPVSRLIGERLPVTAELLLATQLLALALAVPAGVLAAYRVRRGFDRAATSLSVVLLSTPPFLIGILLMYLFAVQWGLLPASGFVYLDQDLAGNLRSLALPALTLALAEFPVYMRLLRSDMIQTLQQDFITVARAKGLAPARILLGHALRPSSFSLVTAIGINMGRLIGGAVIVEVLFALPGIGQLLVNAVFQHDHYVIQGVVLLVAATFVLINVAVDLLYALLDPRVRHVVAGR